MSRTTESPRLPGSWRLLRASWRDYRRHFKLIVLITGVVVLPVNLLGLIGTLSQDAGFGAYTTVASIFMNVALIYALVRVLAKEAAPRLGEAYYEGTARTLAFILASLALIVMLLPAALALTLYLIGTASPEGVPVAAGELILIGLLSLILALPSLWLLTRFVLAPYLVVASELAPLAALRRARELTLGRFWRLLGRLLVLGLALLVIAILAVVPSFLIGLVLHSTTILQFFFQVLVSLIALPIADLYLLHLYRQLDKAS